MSGFVLFLKKKVQCVVLGMRIYTALTIETMPKTQWFIGTQKKRASLTKTDVTCLSKIPYGALHALASKDLQIWEPLANACDTNNTSFVQRTVSFSHENAVVCARGAVMAVRGGNQKVACSSLPTSQAVRVRREEQRVTPLLSKW